ncbi:PREDICTED: protein FAM177A1 isoform X3 [Dipodomys ordii]|uniref:Protein FAM177A1 isoform X3 n=1 Tax=Dipodomys ordii TaxID=10020 RepID=A0A1S3EV16_DIPOR|nr:PREDICTED: protein FAM177A1 isoform X3 [Dipodomys ordii]
MEVGLSAITLCLASSPVAATTMDRESAGCVEEAVTTSGAAATAALGDSARQMSNERGFENVELGVIGKKKKVPRRVIHFVSGETMEEYSTDEDEVDALEKKDVLPTVDPEEEEEEENRMSEEAERQYQKNKLQADSIVQTDQPETMVSSSFVNLNFEMEEDCEVITESKPNAVPVPP